MFSTRQRRTSRTGLHSSPGLAILLSLTSVLAIGCAGFTASSTPTNPNPPSPPAAGIVVTMSPKTPSVRAGDTQQFSATVTGSSNTSVTWQVNGAAGDATATGTISASGLYTAPASLTNPASVTIKAVSVANTSASDSISVALLNPTPVLSGINPASVLVGMFTVTANGSKFVSGAQVLVNGTPLGTTFVSTAQLTASGSAQTAGTFAVSVQNPNPGSSSSGTVNLQVTPAVGPPPPASACGAMSLGQGASLNGFVPFPSDNLWNKDISAAPVDPNSGAIINFIGTGVAVHADFGAGIFSGSSIGIPYSVVNAQQTPLVDINFTAYGSESDPGPMPIPANAPIEGFPNPGNGDRHVLVLDNANCWLYELYSAVPGTGGAWNAGSAAVWDLLADEQRPWTWTSADAAGLAIFAGLVRYDEVAAGQINHAIRFTLQSSRAAFVAPASHWAANSSNANAAPMGMRMRLKSSFNLSGYSAANQVILRALQKYGMIMADNGSSMYLSGAPDDRWDNNDLHLLGLLHTSDFEVVQMGTVYTPANVPSGAAPAISIFTASSLNVAAGSQVTLSWSVSGESYIIVSPQVGPVRGTSVTISPGQTTTYTLTATNQFGRSTASVTITTH